MNLANLPFDTDSMLQGLKVWVDCESPTWDANAVNSMLDLAARDMAIMGATIERIAGRQGFGGCIRALALRIALGDDPQRLRKRLLSLLVLTLVTGALFAVNLRLFKRGYKLRA